MAKAGLLFVGTDDGLALFSNPNNIGRWLKIGQPFRGHAVRAVWPLADNPLVVFAAVAGLALQRSDDGGQSWRAALELEVGAICGAPRDPRRLYLCGSGGEVFSSADAGQQWEVRASVTLGGAGCFMAAAPEDALRLYLGSAGGVLASADGGAIWARYGEDPPGAVEGLAASPDTPGLLYATGAGGLYACEGGRWRQLDGAPAQAGALAVLAGKAPALLLAHVRGGIARSDDGGANWAMAEMDVGDAETIAAIAPASYHMDTAFAGGAGGLLLSSADRGRTWQTLKRDLPPIRCVAAARLA